MRRDELSPAARFACDDDDDDDDGDYEDSWIAWFLNLDGHEFLAEIEEEYIRDRFNLFGLKSQIPNFEKALVTILSEGPAQDGIPESEYTELFRDARDLYGLIHARYITSPRGLAVMKDKFMRGAFGHCPRVLCDRQHTLPVGLTDQLDEYNVRLYCPKCQETYEVSSKGGNGMADGAYFGTSFPHVFLQSYPNLVPIDTPVSYVPKIFGFRVWGKKSLIQMKLEMGEYGDSVIPAAARYQFLEGGRDGSTSAASAEKTHGGEGGHTSSSQTRVASVRTPPPPPGVSSNMGWSVPGSDMQRLPNAPLCGGREAGPSRLDR